MNEALFEIAWAKVKGTTIIHETVGDLDKVIFKYLKTQPKLPVKLLRAT